MLVWQRLTPLTNIYLWLSVIHITRLKKEHLLGMMDRQKTEFVDACFKVNITKTILYIFLALYNISNKVQGLWNLKVLDSNEIEIDLDYQAHWEYQILHLVGKQDGWQAILELADPPNLGTSNLLSTSCHAFTSISTVTLLIPMVICVWRVAMSATGVLYTWSFT